MPSLMVNCELKMNLCHQQREISESAHIAALLQAQVFELMK